MSEVTIYHNPRCSKSRQTMALLEEKGVEPNVILYLETPPDAATITSLLKKLGLSARELMRTKEDIYKALDLASVDDEAALISAMTENPKLIERPIVVSGQKAALGRPPENVLGIL